MYIILIHLYKNFEIKCGKMLSTGLNLPSLQAFTNRGFVGLIFLEQYRIILVKLSSNQQKNHILGAMNSMYTIRGNN